MSKQESYPPCCDIFGRPLVLPWHNKVLYSPKASFESKVIIVAHFTNWKLLYHDLENTNFNKWVTRLFFKLWYNANIKNVFEVAILQLYSPYCCSFSILNVKTMHVIPPQNVIHIVGIDSFTIVKNMIIKETGFFTMRLACPRCLKDVSYTTGQ